MQKVKFNDLVMKVLNATAIGIVVALIPNAVLGELFKALTPYHTVFATLATICKNIQWIVAPMIGFLAGMQFGFNGMKSSIIAAATWIGSGALYLKADGTLGVGLGDLINVIIVACLAVLVTLWLGDRLKSLTIILQPIIVGVGVGFIGILILPYVQHVTTAIGSAINYFTTLQPFLMCLLIAMSFGVIIVSPISTVAISIAIGITGLASGAANLGVASTAAVLVVGSWAVNASGVTIAVGMGAMKMMIPNLVKNPIMFLPILVNAAVCGIAGRFLGVVGDKVSAGFGFVGLVGPIKALSEYASAGLSNGLSWLYVVLAYVVVPFGTAVIVHLLCTKVFKIYSPQIYKFDQQ